MKGDAQHDLTVESLYGARSDAPLVKLKAGPHEWLLPPEKARELGRWLQEAAEAAYGDAFLIRWLMQATGVTRDRALPMLRDFRHFRELQRRQGVEHEEADQQQWTSDHDE